MGGLGLETNTILEDVVGKLSSSGGLLNSISKTTESLLPIIIFFIVGVFLVTKRSIVAQVLGAIFLCTGIILGLIVFRSSRGF